jgi:hypothetical protein
MTAEEELAARDTSSSSLICAAARKDFPLLFKKRDAAIDLDEWEREIATLEDRPSFRIDWDVRRQKYVGSIEGIDSLAIVSMHPSAITMELVRVSWHLKAIELLGNIEKR